jgi:hypothetical protein
LEPVEPVLGELALGPVEVEVEEREPALGAEQEVVVQVASEPVVPPVGPAGAPACCIVPCSS